MRSETAQTPARTSDTITPRTRTGAVAAALACAVALLVALGAPAPAGAATLAQKQALAGRIAAQVDKLDTQLSHLQERYRGASARLSDLDADVRRLSGDLERQEKDLSVAQRRLVERAVTVYENGAARSELVHLAQARSFSNLLARVETVQRVSEQDSDIVDEIRVLRARVAKRRSQLRAARAEQRKLVAQARRNRDAIAKRLDARQAVLSSVNNEIRSMVEAQRRAAAARAAAASRAAAARLRPGTTSASGAAPVPSTSTDAGTALSAPAPAPSASGSAAAAASIAMRYLGVPYRWGGSSPSGFDCSGLVMYAFAQVGISLPHSTYALWNMGTHVSREQLAVGDLVFFSGLGHMGIYVGGGSFVHAPRTGDVVKISSMNDRYGSGSYVGAVRL